jgi:DNA-binding MarR family transcriptional regulator
MTKPHIDSLAADHDVEQLRALVQTFVRRFGLLITKATPCGQPLSPSHAHALMVLLERAGRRARTSQSDLGAALGIDKSNVARLCARMEAAGHVTQQRPAEDGRARLVRLTSRGAKLARRIEQGSRRRFERVVAGIAPRHRQPLFESLACLNAALEALGDPKSA